MIDRIEAFGSRIWQYWFGEISPYPLAAFRIAFGSFLFILFLTFGPYVPLLFSQEAVYQSALIPSWLYPPVIGAWAIFLAMLTAIMMLILGYRTRWVTPAILGGYIYYFIIYMNSSSYDRIIILCLTYMCFGNLDSVWSIRPTRAPGVHPHDCRIWAWVRSMLQMQVGFFYFGAGLCKLAEPMWHGGKVLLMTITSGWGTKFGFWFAGMDWPMWFYDYGATSVIAFELLIWFLLFNRKLRPWAMGAGLLFHGMIWVMLNIWQFSTLPLAYLLWLEPDTVRQFGEKLHRKVYGGVDALYRLITPRSARSVPESDPLAR